MKWDSTDAGFNDPDRRRAIFAWLPKRCNDGFTRWLEPVVVVERPQHVDWGYCVWKATHYEPVKVRS